MITATINKEETYIKLDGNLITITSEALCLIHSLYLSLLENEEDEFIGGARAEAFKHAITKGIHLAFEDYDYTMYKDLGGKA